MFKNLRTKIQLAVAVAASAVMISGFSAPAVYAAADINNNLCAGANLEVGSNCETGGITDAQAQERINNIIQTVINIFSIVVGVVSVIMIILGGLKYVTSGGDSSNVTGAKNTILYAIIGLVIVSLSQFIVRFVLSRLNAQ